MADPVNPIVMPKGPWNPSLADIARAIECPVKSVSANWPLILDELAALRIRDCPSKIIVLATVAVETAHTFKPIREMGSKEYFVSHYWDNKRTRRALGNVWKNDSWRYCGHGFIQLTGRHNFAHMEGLYNIPILAKPELAMVPENAAKFCARFVFEHGIAVWAKRAAERTNPADVERAVQMCRRLTNGGLNGWATFRRHVFALSQL